MKTTNALAWFHDIDETTLPHSRETNTKRETATPASRFTTARHQAVNFVS